MNPLNNSTQRHFNFCPGPAAIPTEVLEIAQAELLDFKGLGCSVMEISHRSDVYLEIAHAAKQDLIDLLTIPEDYEVLFIQGGASLQFAMAPLNLLGANQTQTADYFNTGIWSKKAIVEAERLAQSQNKSVNIACDTTDNNHTCIPNPDLWVMSDNASYCHYTPNETIQGLAFDHIPVTGNHGQVPLVADYSSQILSGPLDVSRFGIIYAGAQKNIGPSGMAVVIIRKDLVEHVSDSVPKMLQYKTYVESDSMFNTPPTFSWYLAGLVFKWLKQQGGLSAMHQINLRKAQKLYQFIDQHDFYSNPVASENRSIMNVPFILRDESENQAFLHASSEAGLLFLKGHRSVGGMRASIYNAVPEAGVDTLIDFMAEFAKGK